MSSCTKMHTSVLGAELMHGGGQTNRRDDVRRPARLYERARQAFSTQPSYYAQTPMDTAVGLNCRLAVCCLHPWWCSVFNTILLYVKWDFDAHQLVFCCIKQQFISWRCLIAWQFSYGLMRHGKCEWLTDQSCLQMNLNGRRRNCKWIQLDRKAWEFTFAVWFNCLYFCYIWIANCDSKNACVSFACSWNNKW